MPLGVEVGLGPGYFVFDGDPAPPEKGHTPTQFWSMSVVDKRLDDQDATWCEGTCLNFLNQTFDVYRK